MKALYFIQTHKNVEQIFRLVRTIKTSSPRSFILVSHDFNSCNLDTTSLRNLLGVEVISTKGGRGNFSIVQGYLDALGWLFNKNIKFDWFINLTGQDYPIQPLPQIEKFLAETKYDGFLEYFDVLSNSKDNPWGSRNGRDRYFYKYWQLGESLPAWQRALVKLPRILINNTQPLVRINSSYGIKLGIRTISTPFSKKFSCYGGSNFKSLSGQCVRYLHKFVNQNPDIVSYYKETCIPDESFIQTILVNSRKFSFCNDHKRYVDWSSTRYGHPRILTVKDYPEIIKNDSHFARKFDITQDSKILDMLDTKIL